MIPYILTAVGLVLFVLAMIGPQFDDLRWQEAHHAYWGVVLTALGYWFHVAPLAWLGAVLVLDDGWQHAVQRFGKRPWYRSPLHQLYGVLYERSAWVRALNRWVE